MKLPTILENVFQKKPRAPKELYLSCLLGTQWVQLSAWEMGAKQPKVLTSVLEPLGEDSWEQRYVICNRALTEIQNTLHGVKPSKAVLAIPSEYLTDDGDIAPDVRIHIKKLLKDLGLTPLGFVPIHQAIIYGLKSEEGIPPNAVLLSLSKKDGWLYLYKIGQLSGFKHIDFGVGVIEGVESTLRGFTEIEVLPSRILLYGGNKMQLEDARGELLKHPWQTRANFLHFPKIEILSEEMIASSVSVAGASELALAVREDMEKDEGIEVVSEKEKPHKEPAPVEKETIAQELLSEETKEEDARSVEESNVAVVSPGELGFSKNRDILEKPKVIEKILEPSIDVGQEEEPEERKVSHPRQTLFRLPKLYSGILNNISLNMGLVFGGATLVLLAFFGFLYWFVPRAAVTIYVVPITIAESPSITIDPEVTAVDTVAKVIPGKKQEKSLTGEKVIPVTGKKKVGDPAKGAVTIYNKSLSSRTIKKGAVVSSGSIQFTLDNDVQIASASENLVSGTVTFGKANSSLTAVSIGPQSNLSANTEFSFKDVSTAIAVARNDQALTGGTSRDATVVTRADYDALTKVLSEELSEKAQAELLGNTGMTEKLLPETVKTTVTEKKFTQELDQESQELQGSVTVTVTGLSYNTSDFLSYLKSIASEKIPSGYALNDAESKVEVGSIKIGKDGKIKAQTTLSAIALPMLDTSKIQKDVTGKTVAALGEYLKNIVGVGGLAVTFRFSPMKNRLPANNSNISISVAIQK